MGRTTRPLAPKPSMPGQRRRRKRRAIRSLAASARSGGAEGQAPAHAGGDGKSAPPHRARGGGCAHLWHRTLSHAMSRPSPTICSARCRRSDDELREKADASVKALLDGVELTERELLKALEKNGIRKIEPQGEKFDPNFHQAMYEVPDRVGALRPCRAGRAAGLRHRRSRAAPGFGRRLQGRPENERRDEFGLRRQESAVKRRRQRREP